MKIFFLTMLALLAYDLIKNLFWIIVYAYSANGGETSFPADDGEDDGK